MDLVADRTRTVNPLRTQLTDILPGLETALDAPNTGPLMLLTGYQTPASLRRTGRKTLETRLRNARSSAPTGSPRQPWRPPAPAHKPADAKVTARMVHTLAREVMVRDQQVAELDKAIVVGLANTATSK
ncbi:hypothetical protein [Streptomyces sp. Root264]|uniref:hypothetical protein n=1 Tax=Streptomyces sp. Root264 TaxID=1736503 RepID=UPI000AC90E25|nr:hypothetical protein [Streptomyces sp. Root264]